MKSVGALDLVWSLFLEETIFPEPPSLATGVSGRGHGYSLQGPSLSSIDSGPKYLELSPPAIPDCIYIYIYRSLMHIPLSVSWVLASPDSRREGPFLPVGQPGSNLLLP